MTTLKSSKWWEVLFIEPDLHFMSFLRFAGQHLTTNALNVLRHHSHMWTRIPLPHATQCCFDWPHSPQSTHDSVPTELDRRILSLDKDPNGAYMATIYDILSSGLEKSVIIPQRMNNSKGDLSNHFWCSTPKRMHSVFGVAGTHYEGCASLMLDTSRLIWYLPAHC